MKEVCGFKVPDKEHRKWAIGSLAGEKFAVKKYLESLIKLDLFEPIPAPQPGDWLFSQDEDGQTFDSFKSTPFNSLTESRRTIAIVPLEDSLSPEFMEKLKKFCEKFYPSPVKVEIFKKIPISSLGKVDSRKNPHSGQFQYNASHILRELQRKVPKHVYCMMGVLNTDIYNKDEWNFVFGLASTIHRTGVFSFARYDERFFDPEAREDNEQIEYRACRVMTHEMGHMFGMKHCIFNNCLMNGSMTAEESQSRCVEACIVCIRKLQWNIKFDFHERYKGLWEFCIKSENRLFRRDAELFGKLAGATEGVHQKIPKETQIGRIIEKKRTMEKASTHFQKENKPKPAQKATKEIIEEYKMRE